MTNTYKIIWSEESLKNLDAIISYLEFNWTEKEIKKFLNHLDKRIQLISRNPLIFPSTQKSRNIHKSVLSKQTSFFIGYLLIKFRYYQFLIIDKILINLKFKYAAQ
jgi:plasmid stabilization system protein ParE